MYAHASLKQNEDSQITFVVVAKRTLQDKALTKYFYFIYTSLKTSTKLIFEHQYLLEWKNRKIMEANKVKEK